MGYREKFTTVWRWNFKENKGRVPGGNPPNARYMTLLVGASIGGRAETAERHGCWGQSSCSTTRHLGMAKLPLLAIFGL